MQLAAFAIARFRAYLVKAKPVGSQVVFVLQLKHGDSLAAIETAYNSHELTSAKNFAETLRYLKGIVARELDGAK